MAAGLVSRSFRKIQILMRLRLIILLLSSCLCLPLTAQRVTWSVEWGAAATVYTHHDFQYTTLEGYHIDSHFFNNQFHLNGQLLAYIGLQTSRRFNLAVGTGWQGLQNEIRCLPVSLRATLDLGTPDKNGMLVFLEGGSGFSENLKRKEGDFLKIGTGYRIPLGYGIRLKFMGALQASICHPQLFDIYDNITVDDSHLEYSDRTSGAVVVSMALEF